MNTIEVTALTLISATDDPDQLAAMAGQYAEEITGLVNAGKTNKQALASYERLLTAVRDQQRLIWERNSQAVQS